MTLILCLAARAAFLCQDREHQERERKLQEREKALQVAIIVMWLCACSICSLSSYSIA